MARKDERIEVRVPAGMKPEIEKAAAAMGLNSSQYVRFLHERFKQHEAILAIASRMLSQDELEEAMGLPPV